MFQFRYKLDNGESFNGKAIPLHKHHSKIFLLLGADDTFYWVNFSDDEVQQFSFDKAVKTRKHSVFSYLFSVNIVFINRYLWN